MVSTEHIVQWVSPAPLWAEAARLPSERASLAFSQPAILRFASDSFMEDFLAQMEADPLRLGALRARPETWREPAPDPPPVERLAPFERRLHRRRLAAERLPGGETPDAGSSEPSSAQLTSQAAQDDQTGRRLKLYQPSHQRYYLVSACLVCGLAGLPDRVIDPGAGERATFVVRRLRPSGSAAPTDGADESDEYAFVGAEGVGAWQRVAPTGEPADRLVPGEEQHPLFRVTCLEDDGRKRRLLAGLVPTGKREAYVGAGQLAPAEIGAVAQTAGDGAGARPPDPRLVLFQSQVTVPWESLLRQAADTQATLTVATLPDVLPTSAERRGLVRQTRERMQTISWYILLDFASFLVRYLPSVSAAIKGSPQELSAAEQALVARLETYTLGQILRDDLLLPEDGATSIYQPADLWPSLRSALAHIGAAEAALEGVAEAYDRRRADLGWPSSLFPLADPLRPQAAPLGASGDDAAEALEDIEALVEAAFPVLAAGAAPAPVPAVPLVARPVLDPRGADWFVLRCVFERPDCARLHGPLVGARSAPFQLAGFFDPDAPARPIRVALPADVSPAGLRKFDKNTAFMLSDLLSCQLKRMRGLTLGDLVRSVLPWPLHKDLTVGDQTCEEGGLNVGMICSLSIPIITICALILLIIIVNLLNIVFRWLPYFLFCFPLPRFRAKESA